MPGFMFQDVVCPRAASTRKWYALPLSFIAHTVILALVIVIPLMAVDALPTPRSMLAYMSTADTMPVVPTPPPAVVKAVPQPIAADVNSDAAPLVTPENVAPESGLIAEPRTEVGVPGVIEGIGNAMAIEPPPLPSAPAAPSSKPYTVGGLIKPPMRVKDVAPVYPVIAQSARVQGDVIISAVIGPDGKVQNARVLRSVPLLDQAAIDAVRSWEYTPTLLNGQPVAVVMTVTVSFRIR